MIRNAIKPEGVELLALSCEQLLGSKGANYTFDETTPWPDVPLARAIYHNSLPPHHAEASKLRKVCQNLRWEIVRDTFDLNELASWQNPEATPR